MTFVRPEDVSSILGLSPPLKSWAELDATVAKGVPKESLFIVLDRICTDPALRREISHRIVSESTYRRRKVHLSNAESERLERLARTYAIALHLWRNDDDARAFLRAPHALLSGVTPLKTAETELGARRVEALLHHLFFGLPI